MWDHSRSQHHSEPQFRQGHRCQQYQNLHQEETAEMEEDNKQHSQPIEEDRQVEIAHRVDQLAVTAHKAGLLI